MKQASGKILDLESLLLDLTGMSDEAVKEVGLKYYLDLFLQNSRFGLHSLHDGEQVYFSRGSFKHAFYKAENWQITKRKNRVDLRRVERIRWILPILQGKIPNTECWLVKEDGKVKKLYLSWVEGYVIWLENESKNKWNFSLTS